MKQNHPSLIFFISRSITLFHFSLAGIKWGSISVFACLFWRKKGIMLQTLRGKQKYHVTNVDVEKIKLSRLLV